MLWQTDFYKCSRIDVSNYGGVFKPRRRVEVMTGITLSYTKHTCWPFSTLRPVVGTLWSIYTSILQLKVVSWAKWNSSPSNTNCLSHVTTATLTVRHWFCNPNCSFHHAVRHWSSTPNYSLHWPPWNPNCTLHHALRHLH
jgi:hypothetical protein